MISNMKYLKYLAYFLLITAMIIIVAYVTLSLSDSAVCGSIKTNLSTNIGDFLWGTIGILLTFISTLFMFLTFNFQQRQFKETKDDAFRTRFEGTFFNMISMLYNVRTEADRQIAYSTKDEKANLKSFYISLKKKYEERLSERFSVEIYALTKEERERFFNSANRDECSATGRTIEN